MMLCTSQPVIRVDSLNVDYAGHDGWINVVHQVSFSISAGETLGLAGESGCGKSTTAYALLGYRRHGSRFSGGAVYFDGEDLLQLTESKLKLIRGAKIGLVPQNPLASLNPSMPVGIQVVETMEAHGVCRNRSDAMNRCLALFAEVGLPNPEASARRYPHQLSGGQQQRVVIAIALSCRPKLLVLDEPTTGLDVTTQARILGLLVRLQAEHGIAVLYVSHNMAVLAQVCHRLAVMYAGQLVEFAPTTELFGHPRHPYTRGLIAAALRVGGDVETSLKLRGLLRRSELPMGCRFAPRCDYAHPECFSSPQSLVPVDSDHHVACWRWQSISQQNRTSPAEPRQSEGSDGRVRTLPDGAVWRHCATEHQVSTVQPVLELRELRCAYGSTRGLSKFFRRASKPVIRDVSFSIGPREIFALVGESGSGKSTVARAIAGLLPSIGGRILFGGKDISLPVEQRSRESRRQIQLVLQSPDTSLNPRHRLVRIIGRPLGFFFGLSRDERQRQVEQLLGEVHLDHGHTQRFPTELSGGEQQRVAIARALAAHPKLLLCDEILSALDVSVQASILSLLQRLQDEHDIAYLFISHDLAVVRSLAHRVGVLYNGQLCEVGGVDEVYAPPFHPYTEVLLRAVPKLTPRSGLADTLPTDSGSGSGEGASACPFADRCPRKVGSICDLVPPPWQATTQTHAIRCHIPVAELVEKQTSASMPSVS